MRQLVLLKSILHHFDTNCHYFIIIILRRVEELRATLTMCTAKEHIMLYFWQSEAFRSCRLYLGLSRCVIHVRWERSLGKGHRKNDPVNNEGTIFRGTKQAAIELLRLFSAQESNLIASWFNCLFRHYAQNLVPSAFLLLTFLTRVALREYAASTSWTHVALTCLSYEYNVVSCLRCFDKNQAV